MNKARVGALILMVPIMVLFECFLGRGLHAQNMDEVVLNRQIVMKEFGRSLKKISAYARGGVGNTKDMEKLAGEISRVARLLPEMFPVGSSINATTDTKTVALPIIWAQWDKFKELTQVLSMEATRLQKIISRDDKTLIQRQIGIIGKNTCGACHDPYRAR